MQNSFKQSTWIPVVATLALVIAGGFIARSVPSGPIVVRSADASLSAVAAVDTSSIAPEMRVQFEALIKDYLLRNPEVIAEVSQAYQAKMEKQQAELAAVAMKESAAEIFQPGKAPSSGNPKGDVTVVEFFDYNCGYCKKALSDVAALAQQDKNVRIVLKEFPILSRGSEEAARVAIAAKKQGKYWDFHLAMLGNQGQANEAVALKVAEKVGLDMGKLKTDMASPEVKQEIDDTRTLARKLGIEGTPHFLVGDKVIGGAPEDLAKQLADDIADIRKAGGCKVCGG